MARNSVWPSLSSLLTSRMPSPENCRQAARSVFSRWATRSARAFITARALASSAAERVGPTMVRRISLMVRKARGVACGLRWSSSTSARSRVSIAGLSASTTPTSGWARSWAIVWSVAELPVNDLTAQAAMAAATMPAASTAIAMVVLRFMDPRFGARVTGRALVEQLAQLVLGLLERAAAAGRQSLAGAIYVEGQHRHRRPQRRRLAPPASLGRALQRHGNVVRAALLEHAVLEIERIAFARHLARPLLELGPVPRAHAGVSDMCMCRRCHDATTPGRGGSLLSCSSGRSAHKARASGPAGAPPSRRP